MKEENKMKKSMPRKGSEKGSRSTRGEGHTISGDAPSNRRYVGID
jgi:hypothetical protein